MSNFQTITPVVEGLAGSAPQIWSAVTTDNFATITATGYLDDIAMKMGIKKNDTFFVNISDLSVFPMQTGLNATLMEMQVTYSASHWSLVISNPEGFLVAANNLSDVASVSASRHNLGLGTADNVQFANIQAGASGAAGTLSSFPATASKGSLVIQAVENTGNTLTTISNAAMGQASVISIPDPGVSTSKFILADSAGTQHITTGGLSVDLGNLAAGSSGHAGTVSSFPGTAARGSLVLAAVDNTGNTVTTISNAAMAQASVVSIPDPGAATANFVLDAGTASQVSIANLKYGATPVAQVDPASCTITAAAGAANTATVTVQLKDGSGTNLARSMFFRVYASSAADGLTLASAASTGFSVASGGLSLANGTAVTTQISAMSSATGGCVLSLLDTGKQTSYLVLVLPNGNKISAQLSAGSYG